MNDNKRILVFTACYNEKENIEKLIKKITEVLPEASILIIDDNSPDLTKEIIKKIQKDISKLNLIVREKKLGLDTAHKTAYDFAIKNNYEYLITMDADFSHDPIELTNFTKNLENYPFVIGSRYIEGGKCLMKGSRLIMSKIGNLVIKIFSGINCNEFTTSYRGFNIAKLNNFHLKDVKEAGYSFFMGTLFEINKKRFVIKEIPIVFFDREKGMSKIPRLEIFRTLKNLMFYVFKKIIN
jgi:glycosyltransferase involved in cell wall biosynthesis